MADNIKVLGSSSVDAVYTATDNVSDVHYPVYKLSYGVAGQKTLVTDIDGLPVRLNDPLLIDSTIPVNVLIDDASPVDVAMTGVVILDSSTPVNVLIDDTIPIDVAVTGDVLIDSSTPVNITGLVLIDDSTPVDVNLPNITDESPLQVVEKGVLDILAGQVFYGFNIQTSINDGNSHEMLIVTGAAEALVLIQVQSLGDHTVQVFEDTVASADGAVQTNLNAKRSDLTTSIETLLYDSPNVTTDGTPIAHSLNYGGEKQSVTAADSAGGLVLKANTKHVVRYTNESGVAANVSFEWKITE